MKRQEIYKALCKTGFPVAFYEFKEGEEIRPPYIAYLDISHRFTYGTDQNMTELIRYAAELYTDHADDTAEKAVEDALRGLGVTFTKDRDFIKDERIFMTLYEFETLGE